MVRWTDSGIASGLNTLVEQVGTIRFRVNELVGRHYEREREAGGGGGAASGGGGLFALALGSVFLGAIGAVYVTIVQPILFLPGFLALAIADTLLPIPGWMTSTGASWAIGAAVTLVAFALVSAKLGFEKRPLLIGLVAVSVGLFVLLTVFVGPKWAVLKTLKIAWCSQGFWVAAKWGFFGTLMLTLGVLFGNGVLTAYLVDDMVHPVAMVLIAAVGSAVLTLPVWLVLRFMLDEKNRPPISDLYIWLNMPAAVILTILFFMGKLT